MSPLLGIASVLFSWFHFYEWVEEPYPFAVFLYQNPVFDVQSTTNSSPGWSAFFESLGEWLIPSLFNKPFH